jgi:hypothetical protein
MWSMCAWKEQAHHARFADHVTQWMSSRLEREVVDSGGRPSELRTARVHKQGRRPGSFVEYDIRVSRIDTGRQNLFFSRL